MAPQVCPPAFRIMWVIAMFDLPVDSAKRKKAYTRFRKALLRDGFTMLQYSVYARFCGSSDTAQTYTSHVQQALPAEGQVRILQITDNQFGKMQVFVGKKREKTEEGPMQLEFF